MQASLFGANATLNLIRLPPSDKQAHIACYLPTGAGKTWRVVIPNLLANPEKCGRL